MQSCTVCNTESPDSAEFCVNCKSDLREYSSTAVVLKKFQANPRVKHVILSVHDDACPVCLEHQGAYQKDEVPHLPIEGCSHPEGCRCFYQPALAEIYP